MLELTIKRMPSEEANKYIVQGGSFAPDTFTITLMPGYQVGVSTGEDYDYCIVDYELGIPALLGTGQLRFSKDVWTLTLDGTDIEMIWFSKVEAKRG